MACGRPVLACFDKDTMLERITVEQGCGLFSVAEDATQLSENIVRLSKDIDLCKKLGENARDYIEQNLTRAKCTQKITKILETARQEY